MKYKFIYRIFDLTSDEAEGYKGYRYFHRVKTDEDAIRRAREFIRKENWFEHITGDTGIRFAEQLFRVVKTKKGEKEELIQVEVKWFPE